MDGSLLVVYSNLGIGGMPRRLVDVLNAMGTTYPNTKIYVLLKEYRKFDLRSTITNPNVLIKDFYNLSPFDSSLLFMLWVWAFIFVQNPSTILSFISPYGLPVLATKILFFWRKTNIIINEGHYTSTMIASMAGPTIQRWGIRLLYPKANAIIVPTQAIKNDLHVSFGVPVHKILMVPNWTKYANASIENTKKTYDVVYVGRMEKEKNIYSLLTIFHTLIKTRGLPLSCLLIGDGSELKRCFSYISTNNLNHNISIRPPATNIDYYLKRARIFVFNPNRTTEGFPVAILEAMACGAVVVTKEFLGAREVINATNGYVVTTDEEMVKRIELVLRHYAAQKSIIKRAKQQVKRLHSPKNIKRYTRLFTF